MSETGRSLAWRWVMVMVAFGFTWAVMRPADMTWGTWAPALWLAGLVWLGWSVKNWLLGLGTGLIVLLHPAAPWQGVTSGLGMHLAGLALVAAWCVQFGELVWHSQAGRRSWLSWTAVGGIIVLVATRQGLIALILALGLIWLSGLMFVLLCWHQHRGNKEVRKKWLALASLVLVTAVALTAHIFWPSHPTASLEEIVWPTVWSRWQQGVESFLPWPNWLGGIWIVTILLCWGWWRTIRRAWRCAKEGKPPAGLVLTLAALLLVFPHLFDPEGRPEGIMPVAAMLLGYLVFDTLQSTFERMRLEPPTENRFTEPKNGQR